MYQGKNGTNLGIHPDVQYLPITQKIVANAIICSMVNNDPFGYCDFFTNNRYFSVELAVFLRERCKVLTAGIIRKKERA